VERTPDGGGRCRVDARLVSGALEQVEHRLQVNLIGTSGRVVQDEDAHRQCHRYHAADTIRRMRILVTNDDGIYSPGILALARCASEFGQVRIAAPDVEQSSTSAAITSDRPLSYRRTPIAGFDAYRVNGTPSDCVALGTYLGEGIDLVLSGINLGPNVGNGIWHSGTVAAARQAVLLGVRGIAFSTPVVDDQPDFGTLEPWVVRSLELLVPERRLCLLNVNIPPQPKATRWTRQSVRHYDGQVVPGHDPRGREHYWFTVKAIEEAEEGTDRWALDHGFVSITPLTLDLTDDKLLRAEAQAQQG
jgi:5'/3'-nucleotidase